MAKAVCLLSGGLDSATTLAIAKSRGFELYAMSFEYGQRHAFELANGPYGVEVAKQENLRRAAAKLGEQMVASVGTRQAGHTSADRGEARCQLGPTPIDRRLVCGRRFEADERLDRFQQPAALATAEILKVV